MRKRTGRGTGTENTLTQRIAGGILLAVSGWAFIVVSYALAELIEMLR